MTILFYKKITKEFKKFKKFKNVIDIET